MCPLYWFIHDKCQFFIAAVQVWFEPNDYNVTEGDAVGLFLVTSTDNYEFDFNVTLQDMGGSATGESCSVT